MKTNEKETLEALEKEAQTVIDTKVAELKTKHNLKEVFVLKVGDKVAYLRKPNRKDLSMSQSLGGSDYISTHEILLGAVWLEGDESIKNDDDYFLNAIPQIEKLFVVKSTELKKS